MKQKQQQQQQNDIKYCVEAALYCERFFRSEN